MDYRFGPARSAVIRLPVPLAEAWVELGAVNIRPMSLACFSVVIDDWETLPPKYDVLHCVT